MNNARLAAFRSLLKSEKDGAFANLESDGVLRNSHFKEEDKSLYRRLYFGVVEKKITLDYLISQLCSVPLNQMEPEVLCILELGAFQILYLDRIPNHAAIFEAGELSKRFCPRALSLVNGVLRQFDREGKAVFARLELPGKKGLSLRYGYPRFLVRLWQESYGKEQCLAILEAQNHLPALTLRVNTEKIDEDHYLDILTRKGICFHRSPLASHAITLDTRLHPTELYGFEEGLIFVQDAAAQRAVEKLGAKAGERILDLCASPGGKSFGAALDMKGVGSVLSFDLHPNRAELIQKGADRLGLDCIHSGVMDATKLPKELEGTFDRVICDVPCSGYGTIAKKPDIRHKKKEESDALPPIQSAILASAAKAVKTGGVILYSTCTLNPEENDAITDAFLAEHTNFARIGEKETIFPIGGENDGFFCDCLEKRYE